VKSLRDPAKKRGLLGKKKKGRRRLKKLNSLRKPQERKRKGEKSALPPNSCSGAQERTESLQEEKKTLPDRLPKAHKRNPLPFLGKEIERAASETETLYKRRELSPKVLRKICNYLYDPKRTLSTASSKPNWFPGEENSLWPLRAPPQSPQGKRGGDSAFTGKKNGGRSNSEKKHRTETRLEKSTASEERQDAFRDLRKKGVPSSRRKKERKARGRGTREKEGRGLLAVAGQTCQGSPLEARPPAATGGGPMSESVRGKKKGRDSRGEKKGGEQRGVSPKKKKN